MPQSIVLDSPPLSLLTQRKGVARAEECRQWLYSHVAGGARVMVAEIIDYELRRELIRLKRFPHCRDSTSFAPTPRLSIAHSPPKP